MLVEHCNYPLEEVRDGGSLICTEACRFPQQLLVEAANAPVPDPPTFRSRLEEHQPSIPRVRMTKD
jgi:hypothetical protein